MEFGVIQLIFLVILIIAPYLWVNSHRFRHDAKMVLYLVTCTFGIGTFVIMYAIFRPRDVRNLRWVCCMFWIESTCVLTSSLHFPHFCSYIRDLHVFSGGGGGGGTSSNFRYLGSARKKQLDTIRYKVLWKWGVKQI